MKDDALEEIEQASVADISGRSSKYTKSKDVDCDIYNVAVIRKKQTCVRKRNTVYIAGLEESTTNMRYCSRKETHINESVEDGNQYHDPLMNVINHQPQSYPPPNSTITNKEPAVLSNWNIIVSSIGNYIHQTRDVNQEDRPATGRKSTVIRVNKADRNEQRTSITSEDNDKLIEQPVNQIDLEIMKELIDDEAKKAENELVINNNIISPARKELNNFISNIEITNSLHQNIKDTTDSTKTKMNR